jgi:hypothetical protein
VISTWGLTGGQLGGKLRATWRQFEGNLVSGQLGGRATWGQGNLEAGLFKPISINSS